MRFVIAVVLLAGSAMAASPQKDAGERAADAREKVVCKRFVETGSLVRGYRTCKTKWEWERERENLRQFNVSNSCSKLAEGGSCGF